MKGFGRHCNQAHNPDVENIGHGTADVVDGLPLRKSKDHVLLSHYLRP
jgi:hypothetical protein